MLALFASKFAFSRKIRSSRFEMEPKRENTIKLRFGAGSRNPNNGEVFNFFTKQRWTCDSLSAMYRDDFCVFIRFKSDELMKGALAKLGPKVNFEYDDGTSAWVNVTAANGTFKYVRIFGLPPEVDDRQISGAMSKYGSIQLMVRERFPAETGFPIWNGVRGLHMEVTTAIPAQVNIQHVKARIYYDGLQNKCFVCGALDHLKANCPNRKSVNGRLVTKPSDGSFANVVANGKTAVPPPTSTMVVLGKLGGSPSTGNGASGSGLGAGQTTPAQQPAGQITAGQENSGNKPVNEGATDGDIGQPDAEQGGGIGEPAGTESTGKQTNEQSALDLNPLYPEVVPDLPDSDMADASQDERDERHDNDDPMGEGKWSEQKGKKKKKRGRPKKSEQETSGSDTRGGKQFIVPATVQDLLLSQERRSRSRSRALSEGGRKGKK